MTSMASRVVYPNVIKTEQQQWIENTSNRYPRDVEKNGYQFDSDRK